MHGLLFAPLAALFALTVSAQTVTLSATALAPVVARASAGGQVTTSSLPAGPITVGSVFVGGPPVVGASVGWYGEQRPYETEFAWGLAANVATPTPGAFAETDTFEVLLTAQASSPVMVQFHVRRTLVATVGAPTPLSKIDVGNDGTFEVDETSPAEMFIGVPMMLGPQPVHILLRTRVWLLAPGSVDRRSYFRVLPWNNLAIGHLTPGCGGGEMLVAPTFAAGGILLAPDPMFPYLMPTIAVLGLNLQPVTLPGCGLFLPSPDLLVVMNKFNPFELPLPPAVRPVTIWTQGVLLNGSWFATTNASVVSAW